MDGAALHNARVLILGFGRVGKLTAHRMGVLGAKVTVAARDYEDLAWASAYGYEAAKLETLSYELGGMDLVGDDGDQIGVHLRQRFHGLQGCLQGTKRSGQGESHPFYS